MQLFPWETDQGSEPVKDSTCTPENVFSSPTMY